tara:strand:+ start:126 stop:341 length:216 start_codon:yes stop_codon:yes gene_type:complete
MAIIDKVDRKPIIDLNGPDGNAFYLLGMARKLSKQIGLDWNEVNDVMTEGTYEELITAFDIYFGDYVDLER